MTDHRTLGGTCVNRGCLPSKNLIAAAGIIHEASHPRYAGIEPNGPYFSFPDLIRQKDEFIAYYREKKYQSIVGDRISVFEGAARFVDHNGVQATSALRRIGFWSLRGPALRAADRGIGESSIHDERPAHQPGKHRAQGAA